MKDTYQDITDRIVGMIENNPGQWLMPWAGGAHVSLATGKRYRGINVCLLNSAAAAKGYKSRVWGTYKQWAAHGGQVRKGEHATRILLWKTADKKTEDENGEIKVKKYLFAREFTVFNAEQQDGATVTEPGAMTDIESHEAAEEIITASGAIIEYGGDRAFYAPSVDQIRLPNRDTFTATRSSTREQAFYGTAFHELGHWTGHKSRCDRDMSGRFGDAAYAMEELIAELTAAFTCGHCGVSIEPRKDHAQYMASWLTVLKNDKRAIFTAASKAQAAADFLIGAVADEQGQDETAAA